MKAGLGQFKNALTYKIKVWEIYVLRIRAFETDAGENTAASVRH
jgi:hypothetical protein